MLDHRDFKLQHQGWKYCPSCGWACDKEGYNLVDKKPTEKEEENKGGDS